MADGPADSAPPKKPNPSADALLAKEKGEHGNDNDEMLCVSDDDWDLANTSAMAAVKFLIHAVQCLADLTGDKIPPTPPVSRPESPFLDRHCGTQEATRMFGLRSPLSPLSPPPSGHGPTFFPVPMPSPEAHRDELISAADIGWNAQAIGFQQAAISRRFFLKTVPPFSLSEYLKRLHTHCPHSPGVYLVAATYVYRLCVVDTLVPATAKTVHRLCLAAIRVASKAFEDHKWSQDRISKVGGVSRKELQSMEVNLCFLLGFDLFVREVDLKKQVYRLQQAANQSIVLPLGDTFQMRLPIRDAGVAAG